MALRFMFGNASTTLLQKHGTSGVSSVRLFEVGMIMYTNREVVNNKAPWHLVSYVA